MTELFCIETGGGGEGSAPLVLLHGFGGSHTAWSEVTARIGGGRHVLAYDLPGHAGSLAVKAGSAAVAAKSVLADLARRGIDRAHVVGHSMGGTAAALASLRDPSRVASLTLLSPGGFGPEINHRLLRRYAVATAEAELAILLEQFFGWERELPSGLAATQARDRQVAGASAALAAIVETFFDGAHQKTLPIGDLSVLKIPIKVLWGTQDRVLPATQTQRLPGRIAVHIFEGAGHMLPYEIPAEVAELMLENSR